MPAPRIAVTAIRQEKPLGNEVIAAMDMQALMEAPTPKLDDQFEFPGGPIPC